MRRWLVVLLAIAAHTALAAPGRVMRIERPRAPTLPHFCQVFQGQVICVGPPPVIGERIALIDMRRAAGVIGELRVEGVGDVADSVMCPKSMYRVTGSPIGLSSTQLTDAGTILGVRGVRLDNRTRVLRNVLAPHGPDSVALALDLDENSEADIVITQYSCDAGGNATQYTGGRARICFDSYLRRGRELERVVQDVLQQCL